LTIDLFSVLMGKINGASTVLFAQFCKVRWCVADQHARSLSKYKAKVSHQLADDSKSMLRWSLAQIDGLVDETKRLGQENALLWRQVGPQQTSPRSQVGLLGPATALKTNRIITSIYSCSTMLFL